MRTRRVQAENSTGRAASKRVRSLAVGGGDRPLPDAAHAVGVGQVKGDAADGPALPAQPAAGGFHQGVEGAFDDGGIVGVGAEVMVDGHARRRLPGREHRGIVDAPHCGKDERRPSADQRFQLLPVQDRDFKRPVQIVVGHEPKVGSFDPRKQVKRQRRDQGGFFTFADHVFAGGFDQAGGHLGGKLVGGHRPDRIQAQIGADLPLEAPGHVYRRTEQPAGAGGVDKQVPVALARLHQGGKRQGPAKQAVHGPLVAVGPGAVHGGIRAAALCLGKEHPLADAGAEGLVAHVVDRGPGRPLRRDDHRPAGKARIEHAFYGDGKVGDVEVDDGTVHKNA